MKLGKVIGGEDHDEKINESPSGSELKNGGQKMSIYIIMIRFILIL